MQQRGVASTTSSSSSSTKRSSNSRSRLGSLFSGTRRRRSPRGKSSVTLMFSSRNSKKNSLHQQQQLIHESEVPLVALKQQQHQQHEQLEKEEAKLPETVSRKILQQQHAAADTLSLHVAIGQFLMQDCPMDVLPRILAYAGPQMTYKLQQCNRYFYNIVNQPGTWRILCEELYKWKPDEPEPACWKEHYRLNPCIPVDFKSISSAVETVGQRGDDDDGCKSHVRDHDAVVEIQHDLTIWLRPGRRYILPRALTISAGHRTNQVRIETQQLPTPPELLIHHTTAAACHCATITSPSQQQDNKNEYSSTCLLPAILVSSCLDYELTNIITQCTFFRHNEPLFRVVRGTLILRNVHLQHFSPGIDIWNGNAAIQVQPVAEVASSLDLSSSSSSYSSRRLISQHMQTTTTTTSFSDGDDGEPLPPPPPMAAAFLHQVQVHSSSGRGIVTVDGGHLHVHDCYIHDCAGTGVYVGGSSSKATLIQTDIMGNGTGNQRRTGIARGHSGVYVEQGMCVLDDCNVSRNSAAGVCVIAEPPSVFDNVNFFFNNNNNNNIDNNAISNIHTEESLLTMRKTDVLANEYNPLDLPQQLLQHRHHHQQQRNNNNNIFDPQHENNISSGGTPRPRSSILRQG